MNFHEQIHRGHNRGDVLLKKMQNKWFTFRKVIIFLQKGHRGYKVILKYNQARQQNNTQQQGNESRKHRLSTMLCFLLKFFPLKTSPLHCVLP